jgi:hypothetical protein
MGMFDNPAAGRFDPPPGSERFEAPRPQRKSAGILLALGALYFAVEQFDRWWHPRGVWAVAGIVLMFVLAALQFAARRRLKMDEHDPFTNQSHITR